MLTDAFLRAGALLADYEQGSLRYIRIGRTEVLRRVMVSVRDRHWDTILPRITNEIIARDADSFRIEFDASHVSDEVDFGWHGSICGGADGTIRFSISGEPLRRFLRNRIGLCVLHPIEECAGRECKVEHSDGTVLHSRFPELISPRQPFFDVRAISHEANPGSTARVALHGDTFEMEDQRNWSDASFKIYSTPLTMPYPVEVGPGDRIEHSMILTLAAGDDIQIFKERTAAVPRIGVCNAVTATGFVELNRERRIGSWGIDPTVHAADELTMIENLAGQAPAVYTARTFMGDAPIHISPVLVPSIRSADAWVAISVRELALAGVSSVEYNVAVPFLMELATVGSAEVVACRSNAPLKYDAIVVRTLRGTHVWLANFTDTECGIRIAGLEIPVEPHGLKHVRLEGLP